MQIPLQISFENAEPSEAVRAAIGHEVVRLEKYQHHITGCRVAVVAPSTKHRHDAVYRINIWVTIPPHENIVVSHQPSDDRSHMHVEVAIKDAFAAARRQIEALAQRASGKVGHRKKIAMNWHPSLTKRSIFCGASARQSSCNGTIFPQKSSASQLRHAGSESNAPLPPL
jgi:ribosome-associated translation inhibitor RaiA